MEKNINIILNKLMYFAWYDFLFEMSQTCKLRVYCSMIFPDHVNSAFIRTTRYERYDLDVDDWDETKSGKNLNHQNVLNFSNCNKIPL